MSNYNYGLLVIAPSVAAGNALAASFSDYPGDATSFDHAAPLYPPGTIFTQPSVMKPGCRQEASAAPVAYMVYSPITDIKYGVAQAMYDAVVANGFHVLLGSRDYVEENWRSFVEEKGFSFP